MVTGVCRGAEEDPEHYLCISSTVVTGSQFVICGEDSSSGLGVMMQEREADLLCESQDTGQEKTLQHDRT